MWEIIVVYKDGDEMCVTREGIYANALMGVIIADVWRKNEANVASYSFHKIS